MPVYEAKLTHKQRRNRRKRIAEYSETHSIAETARRFGVTTLTVRHSRKEAGLSIERYYEAQVPPSSYAILAKIIEGGADREIAKEYGVSRQFVNAVRFRAGKAGVYEAVNRKLELLRVADGGGLR